MGLGNRSEFFGYFLEVSSYTEYIYTVLSALKIQDVELEQ